MRPFTSTIFLFTPPGETQDFPPSHAAGGALSSGRGTNLPGPEDVGCAFAPDIFGIYQGPLSKSLTLWNGETVTYALEKGGA